MTCWRLQGSSCRRPKRAPKDVYSDKTLAESTARLFKQKCGGLQGWVPHCSSTQVALLWLLVFVLHSEPSGLWHSWHSLPLRTDGMMGTVPNLKKRGLKHPMPQGLKSAFSPKMRVQRGCVWFSSTVIFLTHRFLMRENLPHATVLARKTDSISSGHLGFVHVRQES